MCITNIIVIINIKTFSILVRGLQRLIEEGNYAQIVFESKCKCGKDC